MQSYVALLRGINVGGTGILAMKDLTAICAGLGFEKVRTYIQSGNIVFESSLTEAEIRVRLEAALTKSMGRHVDVFVRTASELRALLAANPFVEAEPSKVMVVFLVEAPPLDLTTQIRTPGGEQIKLAARELFIYYPEGMGRSKLRLNAAGPATSRNLNTLAKLVAMAES